MILLKTLIAISRASYHLCTPKPPKKSNKPVGDPLSITPSQSFLDRMQCLKAYPPQNLLLARACVWSVVVFMLSSQPLRLL